MSQDKKRSIMIVDDDADILRLIKMSLEQYPDVYTVQCVENGKKCINLLQNNWIPDLIILDIMLPDINGLSLFHVLLREPKWENIPVAFISAISDEVLKTNASLVGIDYIEKPFDPDLLVDKVNKIFIKIEDKQV